MELKRIIARDSRSATEKAMALYGPDVLVIANHSIDGQAELIVAIDVQPQAPEAPTHGQAGGGFQAMDPPKVSQPVQSDLQAFEEAMALVRSTQAAGAARAADKPNEPVQPTTHTAERDHKEGTQHQRATESDSHSPHEPIRARELVDMVREEIASLRQEFLTSLKLYPSAHRGDGPALSAAFDSALEAAGASSALRTLLWDCTVGASDWATAAARVSDALISGLQAVATPLPMSGVHAVLGPSGAGKTVMAGRWLRQASEALGSDQVALISYGDNKPGAWSQVQMLGAQAGVTTYRAQSHETLSVLLSELECRRLVIIDTPGAEPMRHARSLSELSPAVAVHAVLHADASAATVRRFLDDDTIQWQSLMLSKLDEAEQPWDVLQHLCNHKIQVTGVGTRPDAGVPMHTWEPAQLVNKALSSVTPHAFFAMPAQHPDANTGGACAPARRSRNPSSKRAQPIAVAHAEVNTDPQPSQVLSGDTIAVPNRKVSVRAKRAIA